MCNDIFGESFVRKRKFMIPEGSDGSLIRTKVSSSAAWVKAASLVFVILVSSGLLPRSPGVCREGLWNC